MYEGQQNLGVESSAEIDFLTVVTKEWSILNYFEVVMLQDQYFNQMQILCHLQIKSKGAYNKNSYLGGVQIIEWFLC